jgi:2-polyprenyl-3-methyl-5-hydroxy-6-metoxy-1,4-benzoquinol methylase
VTAHHLADDYSSKPENYYSGARRDYVAALPPNLDAAVLEIGCARGATGALALAEGKCATYVGVEMFESVGREAAKVLTHVHIGNVETMDLPYSPATFDALICSEVLEHLVDPQAALNRLVTLLKPGARVFASSPNIASWRVILALLLGRFDYQDEGVMDRTHLRWFTPSTFAAMFKAAGLEVDYLSSYGWEGRPSDVLRGAPFSHLLWRQINIHCHKPPSRPYGSPSGPR